MQQPKVWKQWLVEALRNLAEQGLLTVYSEDNGEMLNLVDLEALCESGGRFQIEIAPSLNRAATARMRHEVLRFYGGAISATELLQELKDGWNELDDFDPDWLDDFYEALIGLHEFTRSGTEPTAAHIEQIVTRFQALLDNTSLPQA